MTRIPDLKKKRALMLIEGDTLERLITLANAFQFMEVKGGGKLTIAGEKAVLEAGSGNQPVWVWRNGALTRIEL